MLECAELHLRSLESFSSLVILGDVMVDRSYDLAVIGGGIIGLATAMKLTADYPSLKVAVLELSLIHI